MSTDYEKLSSDPEFLKELRQEELILEVTEVLTRALSDGGLKQSELAERMGRTKGFVSQLFAGGRNLTLRTLSDVALALGLRPRLKLCSETEWSRYAMSVSLSDWKQGNVIKYPCPTIQGTQLSQLSSTAGGGIATGRQRIA